MKFFGEKYSREAYDEAVQNETAKTNAASRLGSLEGVKERQKVYDAAFQAIGEAQKEVAGLHGMAEKEALALNEEYGRLLANANEALKAVDDFERSKLGKTIFGSSWEPEESMDDASVK
jgi:hypothetical protein